MPLARRRVTPLADIRRFIAQIPDERAHRLGIGAKGVGAAVERGGQDGHRPRTLSPARRRASGKRRRRSRTACRARAAQRAREAEPQFVRDRLTACQEISGASGTLRPMNWALIGVPALALAGIGIAGPAEALPVSPPRAAVAAAGPALVVPIAHHRYRYHSRHAGDPAAATDPRGVKPGQWEFTTRLEAFVAQQPPEPQSPQRTSPQATSPQRPSPQRPSPQASQALSASHTTYLSCIQSDRPVPFQFDRAQCKLDSRDRQGPRISWSMTCTNSQGEVRSDGMAQYHGDTMEGTLINHFPGANGKVTDLTQRITGRYLGACPQVAQAAPTPQRPNAAPEPAATPPSGSSAQWVEPPAASGAAKPPEASGSAAPSAASRAARPSVAREAAAAAPAEARPPPRVGYTQHRRHYYRRHYGYSGGGWPSGGGLFGIRIPFLGGI